MPYKRADGARSSGLSGHSCQFKGTAGIPPAITTAQHSGQDNRGDGHKRQENSQPVQFSFEAFAFLSFLV